MLDHVVVSDGGQCVRTAAFSLLPSSCEGGLSVERTDATPAVHSFIKYNSFCL